MTRGTAERAQRWARCKWAVRCNSNSFFLHYIVLTTSSHIWWISETKFRFLMWSVGKEQQALYQQQSTRSSRSRVASNHTGTHIRSTNSSRYWETTTSWLTARATWTSSAFQVKARWKDQPWSRLRATQQRRAGKWQLLNNCLTCAVSSQPAMTHFIR